MKKIIGCSALLVLFLILLGCSSMPLPKSEEESLFILLTESHEMGETNWKDSLKFEGPSSFTIPVRPHKWDLYFVRVEPGKYRITERELTLGKESSRELPVPVDEEFKVPPGSIFLFPVKITNSEPETGKVRPGHARIGPDDQREVAIRASDYVNFGEWIGSEFIGFGPYKPRFSIEQDTYVFDIRTEPAGANVIIDETDWGTSPITANLTPGKHLVQVTKEGFADLKTFLDIETKGETNLVLTAVSEQKLTSTGEETSILFIPFRNMETGQEDSLSLVFTDTLKTSLSKNENLTIIEYPRELLPETRSLEVDFQYAEEQGIDLVLTGHYLERDEKLLVHSVLYETQNEMVKTALTLTSPSGILVFNHIDSMTDELHRGILKVLPEKGDMIIDKKDRGTIISFDRKRTEKEVIDERMERSVSLGGSFIWGSLLDTLDDPPFFERSTRYNGPGIGGSISFDKDLSRHFSLTLLLNPVFITYPEDRGEGTFVEIPLYLGTRYSFLGYRADLYLGLLGEMRYITGVDVKSTDGPEIKRFGPYLVTGGSFDTGIKIYTYERLSRPATYTNIGMIIGLYQRRFELDFTESERVPLSIWLYFGFGGRL